MLSFAPSNRPIAVVDGGEHDHKILFVHEEVAPEKRIKTTASNSITGNDLKKGRKVFTEDQLWRIFEAIDLGKDIEGDAKLSEALDTARALVKERGDKALILNSGVFAPVPQMIENQREAIYINGPSGAGKTSFTARYVQAYHATHPKNLVWIISQKDEDPAYDKLGAYVKRIPLDREFRDGDPLGPSDFENSLVIFDDVEAIPDKKMSEAVYALKNNLLTTGRSKGINIIICTHIAMNHEKTKVDLTECDSYLIFRQASAYHTKRLLKTYVGLDTKTIDRIYSIPSRWVFIKKTFPMYALAESEAFLL